MDDSAAEIERYRDGQEISWPLAAALGVSTGAAATLFHAGAVTAGFLALGAAMVLCLGPLILRPRRHLRSGTVVRVTSETDHPESAAWRPFLPAAGVFLAGVGLDPLSLDPTYTTPLYFTAISASLTWAVRRAGSEQRDTTLRRTRAALAKADLGEATIPRLEAVEAHRGIVSGLLALGAVDGVQVRLWRLAEVLGIAVDDLCGRVAELSRCGVVRTSAVDAGDDPGRCLVELTPVGVRAVHELPRR